IAAHLIAIIHLCAIASNTAFNLAHLLAVASNAIVAAFTSFYSLVSRSLSLLIEQQRSDISNFGKSCQQAEDALSQGMDKLQQMVLESVAAGQLDEQTNTPNMSTAIERLA
ncbi:hypothetical protein S83_070467, partial [Arachis hypogaea]